MKAKVYIGAKKYAVYIGRKIVEKTMNFFGFPARFFSAKDGALKDYKMYGNTVQGLPEEYTQLEYIATTGTQYIDTGVKPSVAYTWFKGKIASTVSNLGLGCRDASGSTVDGTNVFFNYNNQVGAARLDWVDNTTSVTRVLGDSSGIYDIKYLGCGKYDINGHSETITPKPSAQTTRKSYNYCIGCTNQGGTLRFIVPQKIYHCSLYYNDGSGDILEFDGIPAKRNSDNALGMYDTVTNTFFTNAGEGTFIAGPEAQPTPANPIAIESVGVRTKNLFDKDNIIEGYRLRNAITHEYNKGNDFVPDEAYYVSSLVEVEVGKTYIKNSPKADTFHRYHAYNADKVCVRYTETNAITINDGEKYIALCGTLTELNTTQLEEGEITTSYEPYGYKIPVNVNGTTTNIYLDEPLRKLGDLTDYIDFENQKVVRNIGYVKNVQYTGAKDSSGKLLQCVPPPNISIWLLPQEKYNMISTYYENASLNYSRTGSGYYVVRYGGSVWIRDVDLLPVAVSQQDIEVGLCYQLETPTEESITLPAIALQQGNITMDTETKIKPSQLTITGDIDDVR